MSLDRAKRLLFMEKEFVENPGKLLNIKHFQNYFKLAKSTLSEDLLLLDTFFKEKSMGELLTVQGAMGGFIFRPRIPKEEQEGILQEICNKLTDGDRIMQGGFLYTTDVIFDPRYSEKIAKLFYDYFKDKTFDAVVTIETKGIPIALMTAKYFHIPLIIVRKEARVTEGPSVSVKYLSGTGGAIHTMSLPRNALKAGKNLLFIDDFMKAGSTTIGVQMLIEQFGSAITGMGFLMKAKEPEEKLIDDYFALFSLEKVDLKTKTVEITPLQYF